MTQPAVPAVPRPAPASWSIRVFSLPVVQGLLLVYLMLLVSANGLVVRSLQDPDVGWHLRNARELIQGGHFIRADSYTFTVGGKPWINIEWLGELPYYFAQQWLDYRGLYLVLFVVATGILIGIYCLGRMRSGNWTASFCATAIGLLLMTVSLLPRPLLLGWLLLVAEAAVLWSYQKGRDWTWALPILFLLWINTHGSWFIGFVLMVLFVACGLIEGDWGELYARRWSPEQLRKLILVVAASFAALFVNPYGWRLVVYPLDVAFQQKVTLQNIAEWGSLDFHSARGKIVVGVLVVMAVLQLTRRRRWALQDVAFTAIAVYGALTYVRFLFLIGILVLPMLAMDFCAEVTEEKRPARDHRLLCGLLVVALVAMIARSYPREKQLHAGWAEFFPEKALPWVESTADRGNLLAGFNWAGYLEWESPAVKQMIDSRVDIFVHQGVMSDYLRALQVADTDAVLEKYRIRYVLLPRESPMAYLLAHETAWKRTYDDGRAVGFERVQ